MTAPRTAFLVVRASLAGFDDTDVPHFSEDTHFQPLTEGDYGPVQVPEALYSDRAAAERERDRREQAARDLLNPFWLGDLDVVSSWAEPDFRSRVGQIGLNPPPSRTQQYDYSHLERWWGAGAGDWTDAQRAAVWALLDKVRLFEVVETELE